MAKTMVLRIAHREALRRLRDEVIQCLTAEAAVRTAYRKAAPLVRTIVETEYPIKDMRILKKYDAATVDDCVKLRLTAGGEIMFNFDDGTGPLAVQRTYHGKIYLADAAATDAVVDWDRAIKARDKTLKQKKEDYDTLISAARTLEEIEVLWPEAGRIREIFKGNQMALLALTPTVVQRIKMDVAERQSDKSKKGERNQ